MGVHYVKGDLVKDPAIDAKEPEALVYATDGHGGLHLAALEYVVIQRGLERPPYPASKSVSRSRNPREHSAAVALRARVQLHRRAQQVVAARRRWGGLCPRRQREAVPLVRGGLEPEGWADPCRRQGL